MNNNVRLTDKGITIRDMLQLSVKYYNSSTGDAKDWRGILDITKATLRGRRNFEYDRSSGQFVQTGRDIKIEFICKSKPISYKRTDTLPVHIYPVTVVIHNLDAGINSTFKWREGSLFKPKFTAKGMTKEQRVKITEYNIKKGIQMQFFMEMEFLLAERGLLYGFNWAKWYPKKTNPKGRLYFGKHMWFLMKKIILPLITTKKSLIKKALNII